MYSALFLVTEFIFHNALYALVYFRFYILTDIVRVLQVDFPTDHVETEASSPEEVPTPVTTRDVLQFVAANSIAEAAPPFGRKVKHSVTMSVTQEDSQEDNDDFLALSTAKIVNNMVFNRQTEIQALPRDKSVRSIPSTNYPVKPLVYLSCDAIFQHDSLKMPTDFPSWFPAVPNDATVKLQVKDLLNREESSRLLVRIGSLQDALLMALNTTYFTEITADPMFKALFGLLVNSVKDSLKITTSESFTAIIQRRDVVLAASNFDVLDRIRLRASPVLNQTQLFPDDLVREIIEKSRVANQDSALQHVIAANAKSASRGTTQTARGSAPRGRGQATGQGRGRGQKQHQYQQSQKSTYKRPAQSSVPDASGDAKKAKSDDAASNASNSSR